MAKDIKEVEQKTEAAPVSDRERRWKEHVANYIKKNPVKGAAKEKNGEFKEIPASFR